MAWISGPSDTEAIVATESKENERRTTKLYSVIPLLQRKSESFIDFLSFPARSGYRAFFTAKIFVDNDNRSYVTP